MLRAVAPTHFIHVENLGFICFLPLLRR